MVSMKIGLSKMTRHKIPGSDLENWRLVGENVREAIFETETESSNSGSMKNVLFELLIKKLARLCCVFIHHNMPANQQNVFIL
jgi:hypothetical protein